MPTNRVATSAAGVTLTLATEVAVATITPAAPTNQVAAPVTNVEVWADVIITGAASATTCTVRLKRGAGTTGASILPSDCVASVDAAATDRFVRVMATDTAAGFNGANGIYTVTAQAAGAAQTARQVVIGVQPLVTGV